MALLSVMAVYCPSMPSMAEESKAAKTSQEVESKKLQDKVKQAVDSVIEKTVAEEDFSSKFTELDTTKDQGFFDAQQKDIFDNPTLRQNEAINHFENARFYMSKWDTELAEVELRAAIMYMPDMKVAHRDYCLVAMMRGKPLRSLAEFMMVVGLGEAIPLNELKQRSLREEAAGLHYNKGLKHAEESKWKEAISELLWSKKYTPLDPAVHRSLAFAYASNKQYDKAEEQYKYTLSLSPEDALAHADYAIMLSNKGNSDEAMQVMSKAVKLKPNVAALHVDLGWMAESKGDLKTAAKEFKAAASASPNQTTLWIHLGNVQSKLGNNGEARDAYQKALDINPNSKEAKSAMESLSVSEAETGDNLIKPKDSTTSGETNRKFTPLKKK